MPRGVGNLGNHMLVLGGGGSHHMQGHRTPGLQINIEN